MLVAQRMKRRWWLPRRRIHLLHLRTLTWADGPGARVGAADLPPYQGARCSGAAHVRAAAAVRRGCRGQGVGAASRAEFWRGVRRQVGRAVGGRRYGPAPTRGGFEACSSPRRGLELAPPCTEIHTHGHGWAGWSAAGRGRGEPHEHSVCGGGVPLPAPWEPRAPAPDACVADVLLVGTLSCPVPGRRAPCSEQSSCQTERAAWQHSRQPCRLGRMPTPGPARGGARWTGLSNKIQTQRR